MAGCGSYELPFWSTAQHDCFLDSFVFSLSLGARKAELPRYRLSNAVWLNPDLLEGKGTTDWLSQVCDGWWCRISPVCSKTDYDNAKYGSTRMWFKVNSSDPWNIAARLIARERRAPCPPEARHSTPLLLDSSLDTGVTGGVLEVWLQDIKRFYVDASDTELAALLTWHASRVTLASKLVKINKSWDRVQTLVRWEGVESARIYGRAAAEAYHSDIAAALAADAAGVTSIPEIDPIAALADVDAAIASGDADASVAAAARAEEASELRSEPKPAKAAKRSAAPKPAASTAADPRALRPPPLPRAATIQIQGGCKVDCFASDSWSVAGQQLSIPESVWTLEKSDTLRLRYVVAGLAFPADSPCFVVRVARGPRSGEYYLVGPDVVRSLMTGPMRRRAGCRLSRPPEAV